VCLPVPWAHTQVRPYQEHVTSLNAKWSKLARYSCVLVIFLSKKEPAATKHDLHSGAGLEESNIGVFWEERGEPFFAKKGSPQFPILPPPHYEKVQGGRGI
jgi:hypothetical protein